jgi:hypothetical protein
VRQRIYIDTSVFGGYFDEEFARHTIPLFERISWNFKHIVNVQRIQGYNSINMKKGYRLLEIRSPREFERYEYD